MIHKSKFCDSITEACVLIAQKDLNHAEMGREWYKIIKNDKFSIINWESQTDGHTVAGKAKNLAAKPDSERSVWRPYVRTSVTH